MSNQPPKTALVLFNDNGAQILSGINEEEFPGIADALHKYLDIVRDVLVQLCDLKEFRHITLTETARPLQLPGAQSPLALALGTPQFGPDGELQGVTDLHSPLDLQGLLTAMDELPPELKDKVAFNEEGMLAISDDRLEKKVQAAHKRISFSKVFPDAFTPEEEELLASALVSLAPEDGPLEPLHPEDLLGLLSAYVYELAGTSRQPNIFNRGQDLVGRLAGRGADVLSSVFERVSGLQGLVWRLEDLAMSGSRAAVKVAKKAVQPVLIGVVLHHTMRSLENARMPGVKMARMTPAEQVDYYYSYLLGPDWKEQFNQDMADAIKEVEEGYNTDDYREEKRRITAAMLRRLEIEDWDKQRMKHFYYGSYGLGPWYFDMEERLHNPFFTGARAWNSPIENWVGKNKAYKGDIPRHKVDFDDLALKLMEQATKRSLTDEQKAKILAKVHKPVVSVDSLLADPLLEDLTDKNQVVDKLVPA